MDLTISQPVTGSVYKMQSHVHRSMLENDYCRIRFHESGLQDSIQTGANFSDFNPLYLPLYCEDSPFYTDHTDLASSNGSKLNSKKKSELGTWVAFGSQTELDSSHPELTIAMQHQCTPSLQFTQKLEVNKYCVYTKNGKVLRVISH